MVIGILVVLMFVALAVYFATGRSIFFWGAKGCIWVDAALICAGDVASQTVAKWIDRLPETVQEVQRGL